MLYSLHIEWHWVHILLQYRSADDILKIAKHYKDQSLNCNCCQNFKVSNKYLWQMQKCRLWICQWAGRNVFSGKEFWVSLNGMERRPSHKRDVDGCIDCEGLAQYAQCETGKSWKVWKQVVAEVMVRLVYSHRREPGWVMEQPKVFLSVEPRPN